MVDVFALSVTAIVLSSVLIVGLVGLAVYTLVSDRHHHHKEKKYKKNSEALLTESEARLSSKSRTTDGVSISDVSVY